MGAHGCGPMCRKTIFPWLPAYVTPERLSLPRQTFLSAALAVSIQRREIDRRVDIPELFKLYESEAGLAWAVTLRRVLSFDKDD